ncbi:protein suppressor of hairy wing-like [Ruditapes philippinarum]|uniref:protein suppressor of hairy wing-like n=1 Tax=Ruditapes philippinarum TaxID=129788 RepID=UPI00295AF2EB|nr:protein suppressor of hairy wing-like [Ruditapes philippinarum]
MIKSMEKMIEEEKNRGEVISKPRDDFECNICGKAFKTKYKFKRHRGIHEERKKYKCEVCGVILTGEGSYKKHSRRHCSQGKKQKQKQIVEDRPTFVTETVNEVCNICGKEFETKSQLKKHGKIHTDTKKYDCEVCGTRHCNKHKNTGNEPSEQKNSTDKQKPVIVCKVCGQIFSSMNSFRVHKKKHLGVRYYCTRCAQSFTTTDQLKLHERGHDDVRSFKCVQCDSQFKRKSNLTRHMAIHEGTKKFVCHICGKAFVLNESLAAHMKVHEDSPPLSCDICQATFKYENSLKTHQKLHSNLKEFKCSICNREFLRKRTLEDHLKCHEKGTNRVALLAKPSEFCTLCSKGFANAYGLKRHMKKHRLGILKHYNRSCGKNSANNLEDKPNAGKDVKKKKAPQRNQVVVYSNLVDDGNLFEKIDPNCFVEKSTNIAIIREEYHSKQNKYVESDKIYNKGTAMPSDNHKPTVDSEADLEDTDEGYSNEDEDYSLLNSMDKGLKSSLDIKANKQETPREMETEYQTELYIDHNHINTDCDNADEDVKFENTGKGHESNGDEVSAGNSDVIFDAQFITETTYIDKELDIENTIEHMAKDLIDEKGLAEIGSEGHKNDNEFVPFIDNNIKSKCISTDNFASAKDVDQVEGNTQEFDFEYGNYQEHDVKGIKESHIETAVFQRDAQKIVNSLNVDTMTGSEHLQLKVIEENQKGNHVNHYMDTHCFECMICKTGKLFKSFDSFKEHMKRDHDEISESYFECSNCPQKFYDKTEYEAHLRDENHDLTEASNLQCKFCMTIYSSLKSLQNHLRKYHKDNDGTIFRCDHCEKMFASKVLYRNHMDIHIIGKANSRQLCECDICGSEHKSIVALRRHKRVTHSVEEDDVYMLSPQGNVTVEHENNTKNRGENLVREVIAQQEVCGVKDVKLAQEGDGRQNLQVLNCDGFNVANTGKKDQNISGYSTQSKSKESVCNHNGLEEGIIGKHVDMKHGRDENISVQDIDQYVTKKIEADKYRSNENDTDLRKDTIHVNKRKSDQDFVSTNSTKERFQRKFQCIECDKSFHMMSTLKQHMLGHKKESDDVTKLYQCVDIVLKSS